MPVTSQPLNLTGFVLIPAEVVAIVATDSVDWRQMQDVYRKAFERAKAVLRPSVLDRLAPSWN